MVLRYLVATYELSCAFVRLVRRRAGRPAFGLFGATSMYRTVPRRARPDIAWWSCAPGGAAGCRESRDVEQ